MLAIFFFFLILLNAVIFLSGKKIRIISVLSYAFIILFAIGKRYDDTPMTHDLRNYELKYYEYEDLPILEYGFKVVNTIGNELGLSYESFYMLVTTLIISIFFFFVHKMKGNLHLFIVAFMIYYMNITIGQMRNQLALASFLALMPWCMSKVEASHLAWLWNYKYKILISLLIASSFHVSFILYLIPFLIATNQEFKHIKIFILVFGGIFFALFSFRQISAIQIIIMLLVADSEYMEDRFSKYTDTSTGLSSLASVSIFVTILIGLYFWKLHIPEKIKDNLRAKSFSNYMFNVILWSSVFLPLLLLNSTLYRYIRDITFLGVIFIGIGVSNKIKFQHRLFIFLVVIAVCIGWFVFDVFLKGYWNDFSKYYFNTLYLN